jgi:hypothetical protein
MLLFEKYELVHAKLFRGEMDPLYYVLNRLAIFKFPHFILSIIDFYYRHYYIQQNFGGKLSNNCIFPASKSFSSSIKNIEIYTGFT